MTNSNESELSTIVLHYTALINFQLKADYATTPPRHYLQPISFNQGAKDFLNDLTKAGHKVVIVSPNTGYRTHNSQQIETIQCMLRELRQKTLEIEIESPTITPLPKGKGDAIWQALEQAVATPSTNTILVRGFDGRIPEKKPPFEYVRFRNTIDSDSYALFRTYLTDKKAYESHVEERKKKSTTRNRLFIATILLSILGIGFLPAFPICLIAIIICQLCAPSRQQAELKLKSSATPASSEKTKAIPSYNHGSLSHRLTM